MSTTTPPAASPPAEIKPSHSLPNDPEKAATCDALCSLGAATARALTTMSGTASVASSEQSPPASKPRKTSRCCPKQHQLPMFLSKTYHMIDKCDPEVATWSDDGGNFVVKNIDKFSTAVLPMYFKHANFSSFARQLNFYGFRKMRTDPILTSDADPNEANYVRFYHEKFQRDQPELLHDIKRATKSDPQAKDDVDSLKSEVQRLKDTIQEMGLEMGRRLQLMGDDYNRRLHDLTREYDRLAALVQQMLAQQHVQHLQQIHGHAAAAAPSAGIVPLTMPAPSQASPASLEATRSSSAAKDVSPSVSTSAPVARPAAESNDGAASGMLHLSRVALSLEPSTETTAKKRKLEEDSAAKVSDES